MLEVCELVKSADFNKRTNHNKTLHEPLGIRNNI